MRKTCSERKKISLLKDVKIGILFEEKVVALLDVGSTNVWVNFNDGVIKACDGVYGKRGRSKEDT